MALSFTEFLWELTIGRAKCGSPPYMQCCCSQSELNLDFSKFLTVVYVIRYECVPFSIECNTPSSISVFPCVYLSPGSKLKILNDATVSLLLIIYMWPGQWRCCTVVTWSRLTRLHLTTDKSFPNKDTKLPSNYLLYWEVSSLACNS